MNDLLLPKPPLNLDALAQPLMAPETTHRLPRRAYDAVVVGAGVAGLTFVLRLPLSWRVALLTKGALGESNTRYAQGGLSAAIGADDSIALHEEDTLAAGAGLCDPAAVYALVEGAPGVVDWLLALGAHFDRDALTGELSLGREAAHSRRRVLHAGGDATGAEIERALVAAVKTRPLVDIYPGAFAVDLVVDDGHCTGLVVQPAENESPLHFEAPVVVVAAGGAGQLWATTSNPPGATADGLAMALRAGVAVADLEFTQFHPTVLTLPGGAPFLISEAVRGEGAYLRGRDGARFMLDLHPLAELAPRDIVARGIQRQLALDSRDHVVLDLRHLGSAAMHARFPTISRQLAARGLDLAADPIPVAPAAHYFIGGIAAGTDGVTSLPGLLALGEAACTGVHGANRLASNSLLEGLVFGASAAERVVADGLPAPSRPAPNGAVSIEHHAMAVDSASLAELRRAVQQAMSRHVAVIRDEQGLRAAAQALLAVMDRLTTGVTMSRAGWEARNIALAACAIIAAASLREESRGAHFRADFAQPNPALEGRHLAFGGVAGAGWRYGSLTTARVQDGAAVVPA